MEVVRGFQQPGPRSGEVAPKLMDSLAGTETPQGLLAVFPMRQLPLPRPLDFVLIADNLRDPGNLGTLLRSAAAAGVQAVLLSPGTTDAFAPKVLRAGMGAHFRLPVLHLYLGRNPRLCKQRTGQRPLRIFLAEAAEGARLLGPGSAPAAGPDGGQRGRRRQPRSHGPGRPAHYHPHARPERIA